MWPVFTKKKKKSFRPLYSQISSRRVCTWVCCPISAYCPPPHPTPLLLDGRSPSPLAECSTFRGLYKTKLWAPSQQQTHLCSCGSIKERRPILCRFLWLASLTKAFLCANSLAGTADSEIIVFSNQQLQWGSEKENHKLVYRVIFPGETEI